MKISFTRNQLALKIKEEVDKDKTQYQQWIQKYD